MKIKKSHKVIAVFLTINFLQSMAPYNLLFANNNGPKSPEAATFEPIDATDMVNLLTGDFSYVLPLLEVPSPQGGYPLSLNYHAGIAMEQEASWLGLGWNINPGAINRSLAGVPDDWQNIRKYKTIYDQGGVSTSYSGGIGITVAGDKTTGSIGLFASFAENKTFGGENTYSFNAGVSGSLAVLNGSLGLQGTSVGLSVPTYDKKGKLNGALIGISASQSFSNGSTTIGLSYSGSAETYRSTNISGGISGSIGVNFNTKKGGAFVGSIGGAASVISGSNPSAGYNFQNDNFQLIAPIIDFSYQRTRYWVYEVDYTSYNGSLYAGKMDEVLTDELFDWKVVFDGYQNIYSANKAEENKNTSYANISFDSYSVTGQGITGSIKPGVFEEGVLYHGQEDLTHGDSGVRTGGTIFYDPSQFGSGNVGFNNYLGGTGSSGIHFYFENEKSSYLKVNSGPWNTPVNGTNYNDLFQFSTTNQGIASTVNIDGVSYDGYAPNKNRARKGSFIEVFTNSDLVDALNTGNQINFFEAKNTNRSNSQMFPSDGIGAYRITTTDGKTYHYSLPVYQREMFSRTTDLEDDPNVEFFEDSQFEPYATHWLLTAITGPDYVDTNGNFEVDENDFGYWVEFDYGKWSDGYSWRNPPGDDFETSRLVKQYRWGVKDIYYLDKIKTKTHTALFVKDIRRDDRSTKIDIRNGSQPKIYEDHIVGSSGAGIYKGDDNNYYFRGTYDKVTIPYPPTSYLVYNYNHIYVETNVHRSLKLDKIILLNNDNPYANLSKVNTSQSGPIAAGTIDIEERFDVRWSGGSTYSDVTLPVTNRTWQGEFYGNVIDIEDININAPDIEAGALKVIEFDQDYSSMPNSPNSISSEKGKLTLNSVNFKGKNGVSLIPPYLFEYFNRGAEYSNGFKDAWGYPDHSPSLNLNKIITPLGEELEIIYENDEFREEAAITSTVFDTNFIMKFTGSDPGNKWVTFKNHQNNLQEQDIVFTDYFEVGQQSKVNVQYIFDPSGSSNERVADVNTLCTVASVNADEVRFLLPSTSVGQYERNESACSGENWQYYSQYTGSNSVVERTANFVEEYDNNSCEEVSNGEHRAKIQFYSSKPIENRVGGGHRVNEIRLSDESNNTYTTTYRYNMPNSNTSSGITSFEPSKLNKEVKFVSELPPPTVMYEYVTVSNMDSQDNVYLKDIYHFNVLKPMQLDSNGGFSVAGLLDLSRTEHSVNTNVSIDGDTHQLTLSKFQLDNNLSALGRLISKETYNSEDQLLLQTVNEYKTNAEISQGITQETFSTYKGVSSVYFDQKFYLSSSSTAMYPSILKKTRTVARNQTSSTEYGNQDFLTGQPTEIISTDSRGNPVKSIGIPAYQKYPQMGSLVDDHNNKNMLTQQAVNYSLIDDNNIWKPIGARITTWNNDWTYTDFTGTDNTPFNDFEKIWRKHKIYLWDGELDAEGRYLGYDLASDDGFNWNLGATQSSSWKELSSVKKYSHFSLPLEVQIYNDNYIVTKTTDDNSKTLLTCNARYGEAFYTGVEYGNLPGGNYLDSNVFGQIFRTNEKSHTGEYSAKIGPGGNSVSTTFGVVMRANQFGAGSYKLSAWVHKDNYGNARFKVGWNGSLEVFNGEKTIAGNWVLMNHYFDITNGQTSNDQVYLISSESGDVFIDDLRIHPLESSMNSYVHNEYDELTFILGPNNMATKYQYDNAGRLIRVFQETVNTPTINGGFKKVIEHRYNYKRDIAGNGGGDPLPGGDVNFINIVENGGLDASTARLIGDPGATIEFTIEFDCGIFPDCDGNQMSGDVLVQIDGVSDYLIHVDQNTPMLPYAITLPSSGSNIYADFTSTHNNSNNNLPGDLGHTKIIIETTNIGQIGTPSTFEDENSIYNEN